MTEQPKRKPGRPRKERPADDKFNGAPEAAFDHDGDGSPGGSLPRDSKGVDDGRGIGPAGSHDSQETLSDGGHDAGGLDGVGAEPGQGAVLDLSSRDDDSGSSDDRVSDSSVPTPRVGVNLHEQTAIVREAWEAYDMQDDRVRFDSAGRKWVLRMDNSSGHWELALHLSRGLHEASDSVSQVVLGSSSGYEAVEKAVKLLDGAVK